MELQELALFFLCIGMNEWMREQCKSDDEDIFSRIFPSPFFQCRVLYIYSQTVFFAIVILKSLLVDES